MLLFYPQNSDFPPVSPKGPYLQDQFQLLMRCYLPLVFGVIISEYLCHDCGNSQLFFSGRISEQALPQYIKGSLAAVN